MRIVFNYNSNVVAFPAARRRPPIDEALIADTFVCADWAFGGVTELLRRMNDRELDRIYDQALDIHKRTPDGEINAENEALLQLIECEFDRRDPPRNDNGGAA